MSEVIDRKVTMYELYGTELKENVQRWEDFDKDTISLAYDILSNINQDGYADLNDRIYFKISGNLWIFLIECYHLDFVLDVKPWDTSYKPREGFPPSDAWLRTHTCRIGEGELFELTLAKTITDALFYNRDIADACEKVVECNGLDNTLDNLPENLFLSRKVEEQIINKDMIKSAPYAFYTHTEKAVSDKITDRSMIIKVMNCICWMLIYTDMMGRVLDRISTTQDEDEIGYLNL